MKRWISISMILIVLGCLCGCGSRENDTAMQTPLAENMIHLYVVEKDCVVQSDEDYQLKTPDSVSASVDDVMTALLAKGNGQVESYSYMMGEDNSLILELNIGGDSFEKESDLLMMAAITKTLFQLKDIPSIRLTINAKSGDVIEDHLYLRDSFYFYGYEEESLAETEIGIYIPADDGQMLKRVMIKKQTAPDISDQELIVDELVERNILPQGTHVNMVSVHEDMCYLDLSEEFMNGSADISSELAVCALVNSILKQCELDTVQILVDGKQMNTYRGSIDMKNPLPFNSEVVE